MLYFSGYRGDIMPRSTEIHSGDFAQEDGSDGRRVRFGNVRDFFSSRRNPRTTLVVDVLERDSNTSSKNTHAENVAAPAPEDSQVIQQDRPLTERERDIIDEHISGVKQYGSFTYRRMTFGRRSDMKIFNIGHRALPYLKDKLIGKKTSIAEGLGFSEFSKFARALAEPGDEQTILDCMDSCISFERSSSAFCNFNFALNRIIYDMRIADPQDPRLASIADRVRELHGHRGYGLLDTLAMTGQEENRDFLALRLLDNDWYIYTKYMRYMRSVSAIPLSLISKTDYDGLKIDYEEQERERRERETAIAERKKEEISKYQEIAKKFENGLTREDIAEFVDCVSGLSEQAEKAAAFREKAEQFVVPLPPVQSRIVGHDIIMLYDVLVNGIDQEMKKNYKENGGILPQEESGKRELDIDFAMAYVEHMRERSREQELLARGYPNTIGLEIDWEGIYDTVSLDTKRIFCAAGVFTIGDDNGWAELSTTPSASPRLQSDELITYHRSGGLRGSWNMHTTYGDILLDSEQTQIMDISVISLAAKLAGRNETEDIPFEEYVHKPSAQISAGPGEIGRYRDLYFPMHELRTSGEMIDYDREILVGVQQRSLRTYPDGIGSIEDIQKDLDFSYLASCGIRAVQRDPGERTERDRELVKAYEKFEKRRKKLLRRHRIYEPANEERYIAYEAGDDTITPYNTFLGTVNFQAQTNPGFCQGAREIIEDYVETAGEITGYTRK